MSSLPAEPTPRPGRRNCWRRREPRCMFSRRRRMPCFRRWSNEGRLVHHPRAWDADCFADAAIAICDAESDVEARRFFDAARDAGIPVKRDRQAGFLRLPVRLDRQQLACRHRRFRPTAPRRSSARRSAAVSKPCFRPPLPNGRRWPATSGPGSRTRCVQAGTGAPSGSASPTAHSVPRQPNTLSLVSSARQGRLPPDRTGAGAA